MERGDFLNRLALWVVVLLAISASCVCIEDKCGACNAVAAELEIGLSNEKPRNHLDMRHRLDSKGQREGKLIDYRASELRIVELLDGLCEKVQDYTFEKIDSGKRAWIKVNDWDNYALKIDKQEARAYSKDISSYCGRLLEETEDELAEMIKRGSVGPTDVGRVLCEDLSKHCGKSRYHLPAPWKRHDHPLGFVFKMDGEKVGLKGSYFLSKLPAPWMNLSGQFQVI